MCVSFEQKLNALLERKVRSMGFGRVSSYQERAITSRELLQRLLATQRKVRPREHDDLCFLKEKPCQSVDQGTKLFKVTY